MAYGDFKELTRRTASDKVLCDKAFNIARNPKYDGYQCGLALMVFKFFTKETSGGAAALSDKSAIKIESRSDKELHNNYTKQLLENLKKENYTPLL